MFLDLFGRKEYLVKLCGLLHPEYGEISEDVMTMVSPEYIQKTTERMIRIQATIKVMENMGQQDDQIKEYLIKEFNIPEEYAQNCLDAEWEEDSVLA